MITQHDIDLALKNLQMESINDTNWNGNTLIHHAANESNLEMLQFAVQSHPELINLESKDGFTALHYVRSLECFHYLMEKGANLDVLDSKLRHPIEVLFRKKLINENNIHEIYPYLIKKRVDEYHLLHFVAQKGLKDALFDLLNMGCDVNAKSSLGENDILSSIFVAPLLGYADSIENHPACIQLVIDFGLEVNHEKIHSFRMVLPEILAFTEQCIINRDIKKEKELLENSLKKDDFFPTKLLKM
jgi:ankyrin repeat protein